MLLANILEYILNINVIKFAKNYLQINVSRVP